MSSVSELSDQNFESEEFNVSIYEQSNVQVNSKRESFSLLENILFSFLKFFTVNEQYLISFIELNSRVIQFIFSSNIILYTSLYLEIFQC
jgi:hypothetical protein